MSSSSVQSAKGVSVTRSLGSFHLKIDGNELTSIKNEQQRVVFTTGSCHQSLKNLVKFRFLTD